MVLATITSISKHHSSSAGESIDAMVGDGTCSASPALKRGMSSTRVGHLAVQAALVAAAEQLLCSSAQTPPAWAAERLEALFKVTETLSGGHCSNPEEDCAFWLDMETIVRFISQCLLGCAQILNTLSCARTKKCAMQGHRQ